MAETDTELATKEIPVEEHTEVRPASAPNPDPEPEPMPWWKRTRNRILMVAAVVVAAIGIAVGVTSVLPTQLTNRQVLDDFNATSLEDGGLTDSIYASNVAYNIDSETVRSIEDNGRDAKVAYITVVFKNQSFSVEVEATQNYTLVGRQWAASGSKVTSISATPIAPVDEARVLADIDTLLSKVAPRDGVSLATLLADGEFEVESAELAEDTTSCVLEIRAQKTVDLYHYGGILTASFDFVEGGASTDSGSWKLARVTADDECYKRALAPVKGTWSGKLASSETSAVIFDTGVCSAGKDGVALEVTSFNVDTGALTTNIEFVSHAHPALPANSDGGEGDVAVRATGLEITLDPSTLTGTFEPPDRDAAEGVWSLEFLNENGAWKLRIRSSAAGGEGLLWGATTFTDTYTLSRR